MRKLFVFLFAGAAVFWLFKSGPEHPDKAIKETSADSAASEEIVPDVGQPSAVNPTGSNSDEPNRAEPTCANDWHRCTSNQDFVESSSKLYAAQAACKIETEHRVRYGEPKWPGFFEGPPFGRFEKGNSVSRYGKISLAEPNVQIQNAYGAMQHMIVECLYDIRRDKVISLKINGE